MFEPSPTDHQQQMLGGIALSNVPVGSNMGSALDDEVPQQKFENIQELYDQYHPQYQQRPYAQQQSQFSHSLSTNSNPLQPLQLLPQYVQSVAAPPPPPGHQDVFNFNNSSMFNTTETAQATPSSTGTSVQSYTPLLSQQQSPLVYHQHQPLQQPQLQLRQSPYMMSYNQLPNVVQPLAVDYYGGNKTTSTYPKNDYIKQEENRKNSIRLVDEDDLHYPGGKRRYRVIRGVSAGGCATRPPKNGISSEHFYTPVQLDLVSASLDDCCFPKWSNEEKTDRRRIIRIERTQEGPRLVAKFSIVGAASEHPSALPAGPETDVVEVSCLECAVLQEDEESQESGGESPQSYGGSSSSYGYSNYDTGTLRHNSTTDDSFGNRYYYYITSVEVVEIVELLIGTQLKDPADRRKERGRVRSNLVPFWSKKPILSRMNENNGSPDFRAELAKRIMAYDIRKPRGFDKEVRILRWDKLVPALKRALQSYYAEIPAQDSHLFTN